MARAASTTVSVATISFLLLYIKFFERFGNRVGRLLNGKLAIALIQRIAELVAKVPRRALQSVGNARFNGVSHRRGQDAVHRIARAYILLDGATGAMRDTHVRQVRHVPRRGR
jgi:hypothetical protein